MRTEYVIKFRGQDVWIRDFGRYVTDQKHALHFEFMTSALGWLIASGYDDDKFDVELV